MPDWLLDTGTLLIGIALLLVGGDVLVRGAKALAARLGISPLVIGLTVVAFGTSAPELALNASAAFKGNTDLSFGNIIGSNIANVGLILGLTALIKPLQVHNSLLKREIPVMIGVSAIVAVIAFTPPHALVDTTGASGFSRVEGAGLLVGFLLFLEMMRRGAKSGQKGAAAALVEGAQVETPAPVWLSMGQVIFGLAMLVLGGTLAETGATGVARAIGLSDAVIGLTVVAIATSLPELATSLIAAWKDEIDIAVGNVVGSNLFNLLLVLGATATIAPTPVPDGGIRSLLVMTALAVILIPMSHTARGLISRFEGSVLLVIYIAGLAYEVAVGRV